MAARDKPASCLWQGRISLPGLGAGRVAAQEGDIRPPFLEVGEGGGFAPAPLVDRRALPYNPQLLKKLAKLLLVSTQPKRGLSS